MNIRRLLLAVHSHIVKNSSSSCTQNNGISKKDSHNIWIKGCKQSHTIGLALVKIRFIERPVETLNCKCMFNVVPGWTEVFLADGDDCHDGG